MVDLIRIAPAASPNPLSDLDRSLAPAPALADLSQALVRFAALQSEPVVVPAPGSISAMQRLVELVGQLRGEPDSPEAITAEGLVDYVQDEAQDALDALKADIWSVNVDRLVCPTGVVDLKHLALWLMWGVARSRADVMPLMEGVAAQMSQASQAPQSGILRLVAVLEMQMAETCVAIDLATLQPAAAALDSEATIQIDSLAIETNAADLVQQIETEMQTATPELQPFLKALSAEALLPWHRWQSGTLQLCLRFEFTPLRSRQPAPAAPQICLAEPTWRQQHDAAVLRQHIAQALSRQRTAIEAVVNGADPLTAIVQLAWNLADQFQSCRWLSRRLHPEMTLETLTRKLLWSISQSTHEVMQLMGGIPVNLLVPAADWAAGTLRFVVQLKLQMPTADYQLDVTTGQIAEPQDWLPLDAVVQLSSQLQSMPGGESPLLLQQLQDQVQQAIDRSVSELALWRTGTLIDWLDENSEQWQSAIVRLETGFAFMPFRAGMG